jgi:hypothetical protein
MAQQLRERIDKWHCVNLKIFCTTKEIATRLKGSPQKGRKIFPRYTSNYSLINRTYREFKTINSQRVNDPMKKWANELKRTMISKF